MGIAELWLQFRCDAQARSLGEGAFQQSAGTKAAIDAMRGVNLAPSKPSRRGGNRYLEQIEIPESFYDRVRCRREWPF